METLFLIAIMCVITLFAVAVSQFIMYLYTRYFTTTIKDDDPPEIRHLHRVDSVEPD